jgi:hypothetical protein
MNGEESFEFLTHTVHGAAASNDNKWFPINMENKFSRKSLLFFFLAHFNSVRVPMKRQRERKKERVRERRKDRETEQTLDVRKREKEEEKTERLNKHKMLAICENTFQFVNIHLGGLRCKVMHRSLHSILAAVNRLRSEKKIEDSEKKTIDTH